jgi:uncharacterized damage-inducible protein DinB
MKVSVIQQELIKALYGKQSHMPVMKVIEEFPVDKINEHIDEVPYSPWELVDHIRITQADIIDYIQNPDYKERKWPEEYWPEKGKKASAAEWNKSLQQLREDFKALEEIILDPQVDLTAPLVHNANHTLFRELLILANHNSYHGGQLLIFRRVLKAY